MSMELEDEVETSILEPQPASKWRSHPKLIPLFSFVSRNGELKVGYLGLVFCVLFISWSLTQTYVTSIFGSLGFVSLGLVYFAFSFGSFVAPVFTHRLGPRLSMLISASAYVFYIACSALGWRWPLLAASVLVGFFGTILWTSQGAYVASVAAGKDVGKMTGLFFGIFGTNFVIGTIIVGFLLKKSPLSLTHVLWILTATAGVGNVLFTFVAPVSLMTEGNLKTPRQIVLNTLATLKKKRTLFLLPLMFFQGCNGSFVNGIFPRLLQIDQIPFVFLGYGVSRIAGSFLCGYVYDRFGWGPLLVGQYLLVTVAYVSCLLAASGIAPLFYVFGAVIGMSDIIGVNLINSTIMVLYPTDPAPGFAVYRFMSSAANTLGFFLSPYIKSYLIMEGISFTVLTSGTVCFCVLYLVVLKAEKQNEFEMKLVDNQLEVDTEQP